MAGDGNLSRGSVNQLALILSMLFHTALVVACLVSGITLAVATSGEDAAPEKLLTKAASPWFVLFLTIGLQGLQALVIILGFVSVQPMNRSRLQLYLVLSGTLVVFQIAAFAVVLLFGNGAFSPNTATLTDSAMSGVLNFCKTETGKWQQYQNEFKCCGLDLRAAYTETQGGYPGQSLGDIQTVFSGKECEGAPLASIVGFLTLNPTYNDQVQEKASKNPTLGQGGFFCLPGIVKSFRARANAGGIILGLAVVFQVFPIFFTSNLLYSIKEEDGGLKPESTMVLTDLKISSGSSFFSRKPTKASRSQLIRFDKADNHMP